MNNDLISREALKETIIKICGKCSNNITEYDENHIPNGNCAIWHILNMIDNAPTIKTFTLEDIEEQYRKGLEKGLSEWETERPQGEWEYKEIANSTIPGYCCSCCHIGFLNKYNFCPNCGADMRGDEK